MLYLASAVFLACGSSLCVAGVRTLLRVRSFARSAHRAAGMVVGIREQHQIVSDDWMLLRFPIVRFETSDGRAIETETIDGASIALAKVGEPVLIRYDPEDPHVAQLERNAGAGPIAAVLGLGLGVGCCFTGLFLLAVARSLGQIHGI